MTVSRERRNAIFERGFACGLTFCVLLILIVEAIAPDNGDDGLPCFEDEIRLTRTACYPIDDMPPAAQTVIALGE